MKPVSEIWTFSLSTVTVTLRQRLKNWAHPSVSIACSVCPLLLGRHQRFPSTGKALLAVRRALLLSVAPEEQHLTKGHTGQNHTPNSSCYLLHLPGFQSTVSKLWWSNILSSPSCPATEWTGSGKWSGLKISISCWFPTQLQKQLYQQNRRGSAEFA